MGENELNSKQYLGEKLIIERKQTQFSVIPFAIDNIKKTNYLFSRRNFAPNEKTEKKEAKSFHSQPNIGSLLLRTPDIEGRHEPNCFNLVFSLTKSIFRRTIEGVQVENYPISRQVE